MHFIKFEHLCLEGLGKWPIHEFKWHSKLENWPFKDVNWLKTQEGNEMKKKKKYDRYTRETVVLKLRLCCSFKKVFKYLSKLIF